ncbi:hypothetical protein [Escherichia coli]|uniref:hypothetical protein n=1 Tax=Escherichia coli TaxID=562 RepID=UPI0012FFA672|nr:hypothetical protein [Escherichia coli]
MVVPGWCALSLAGRIPPLGVSDQHVCQRSAAQPEHGIVRRTGDGRGHTLIAAPTAKAGHTLL